MSGTELYIETWVDADLEDLWGATQEPDQHERWDLRFTDIDYLPRPDESEPQQFDYETRIGFGVGVAGGGESTAERADGGPVSGTSGTSSDLQSDGGERTSALRLWSDDPKSLISEGNGYWKYLPEDGGVRFLTGYNYDTRFGRLGRVFDRFVFRPLMVWATAWSFDRLRLWLEADVSPGGVDAPGGRPRRDAALARGGVGLPGPRSEAPRAPSRRAGTFRNVASGGASHRRDDSGARRGGGGFRPAPPRGVAPTVGVSGVGAAHRRARDRRPRREPGTGRSPALVDSAGVAMLALAAIGYVAGEELPVHAAASPTARRVISSDVHLPARPRRRVRRPPPEDAAALRVHERGRRGRHRPRDDGVRPQRRPVHPFRSSPSARR